MWVGPPEELRPARRRGKEKIPSREEGPRDLKMRHCCSVVCPSWPCSCQLSALSQRVPGLWEGGRAGTWPH